MITFILKTIGMAIGILVKALLLSNVAAQGGVTGKSDGDDKLENMKEWVKNKLKALASLLEK